VPRGAGGCARAARPRAGQGGAAPAAGGQAGRAPSAARRRGRRMEGILGAAMQTTPAKDSAQTGKEYLSFVLGDAQYCIDILKVQEIRRYEAPTRIANTPPFIKGVINLRGNIVPIVDLRVKLGLPEQGHDAQTVVIVLNVAKRTVGVVVDGVSDVITLKASE